MTTDKPKNDGGPAFPKPQSSGINGDAQSGMTMRDWLAGMALQGLLSNAEYMSGAWECFKPDLGRMQGHIAETTYRYADAMLKEREKP